MKILLIFALTFFLSFLLVKEVKAQDTIPPSTITDLIAYRTFYSDPDKLILEWTSPGDDGNIGNASSYELDIL